MTASKFAGVLGNDGAAKAEEADDRPWQSRACIHHFVDSYLRTAISCAVWPSFH